MARKWLIPILIVIGVFVFSSKGLKGGPEISVKDAVALLKSEPRPVVIDLRSSADYDQGHIASAICVPVAEFRNRLESLKVSKTDVVLLYSADDAHARDVTRHLYESGYQGALTLIGGFDAWREAGQAVVKKP